jgi:hypothetical protein
MNFYFDTSALVKRYHPEKGSDVVDKIFELKGEHNFATSFWAVLEFVVALSAKRKRKELSDDGFNTAIANFLKELMDLFTIRSVEDEVVADSIPHAMKHLLPSADCLHLASALELKRLSEDVEEKCIFVSADKELCIAVEKEKIDAINPREADAMKKLEKCLQ